MHAVNWPNSGVGLLSTETKVSHFHSSLGFLLLLTLFSLLENDLIGLKKWLKYKLPSQARVKPSDAT